MQVNYTTMLENSVLNLLQYKDASIEKILKIVLETMLKAEQTQVLGYENRKRKDKHTINKRNGYRYSQLIKGITKYFRVKIPRDRLGHFKPIILELMKRENERINELIFKLFLKGLTTREISEIMEQIYGKQISASSISNISKEYEWMIKEWTDKRLEEQYYVIYIDTIRIPVRRDSVSKEAFYIILGLRKDLRREILGVYNLPEESKEGWKEVIKDIKRRGVKEVLLFIIDEFKGIDEVIME